jgi:hypothetical protein
MSMIAARLKRLERELAPKRHKPFTVHLIGPDTPEPVPVPAQIQETPHV